MNRVKFEFQEILAFINYSREIIIRAFSITIYPEGIDRDRRLYY